SPALQISSPLTLSHPVLSYSSPRDSCFISFSSPFLYHFSGGIGSEFPQHGEDCLASWPLSSSRVHWLWRPQPRRSRLRSPDRPPGGHQALLPRARPRRGPRAFPSRSPRGRQAFSSV